MRKYILAVVWAAALATYLLVPLPRPMATALLVGVLGWISGLLIYHQHVRRLYFDALQRRIEAQRNYGSVVEESAAWPHLPPLLNAVFTGYARSPFPNLHGVRVAEYSTNWLAHDRVEVADMLSDPDLDGHTIRLLCERAILEVSRDPLPAALIRGQVMDADRRLVSSVLVATQVFPWEFAPEFIQQVRAAEFMYALSRVPRT